MLSLANAIVANADPTSPLMFRFHKITAKIAKRFSPQVANSWLNAVGRFQGSIDMNALRSALAAGNLAGIEAVVQPSGFVSMLKDLEDPLARTAGATGTASAQTLRAHGFNAQFNAVHPNVVLFARDQTADLVVGVTKDVKEAIRTVVAMGAQQGLTVTQQATAIREVVPLAPNQVQAPLNLADDIRNGRTDAATRRRLSAVDKQQIRSRIQRGTVDEAFVSKMQKKYASSLINRRAKTIARTESLRAANFGQQDSWQQAMDQGVLPKDSRRFWLVTPDDRLSPEHATIPSLNPIGRGMNEEFDTPDGLFMYPPSRPNCRCGIGLGIGTGEAAAVLPPQHVSGALPKAPEVISKLAQQPIRRLKLRSTAAGPELELAKGATVAEKETAALMVQGARDVQALGFNLKGITMAPANREAMGSLSASYKAKEVRLLSQPFRVHGQNVVKGMQGKPPWAASDTWSGTVHHEFGHALYDKANPGMWDAFRTEAWKGTAGRTTAKQVSRYATTSPSEFVAETFRGLVAGKEYADDVLRLYVKHRGPIAPKWKSTFDAVGGKVVPPVPPTLADDVVVTVTDGAKINYTAQQIKAVEDIIGEGLKDLQELGISLLSKEGKKLTFTIRGVVSEFTHEAHFAKAGYRIYLDGMVPRSVADMNRYLKAMVKAKWQAVVGNPRGLIHHEVGHALHFRSAQFGKVGRKLKGPDLETARKVSRYATTNHHEFVAETFSGLVRGTKFSDDVLRLYKKLGGHIASKWKPMFDAI